MSAYPNKLPCGIKVINYFSSKLCPSRTFNPGVLYRASILLLTFLSYTLYHASRKPLSVVKTEFNRSCTDLTPPPGVNSSDDAYWCDWAPFYGPDSSTLLGLLDSAFLFAYAASMFLSGFVAERVSLRYFLSGGMIASGLYCILFGISRPLNIHYIWYYVIVQIFGGIVESTGWPGVVAVMGKWYGKHKRGLIFTTWNSHTSVGNIVGTLIASNFLAYDWGYSFIVPGLLIAGMGFINFLFLVETPEHVGSILPPPAVSQQDEAKIGSSPSSVESAMEESADSDTELLFESAERAYSGVAQKTDETEKQEVAAIGIFGALKIPGVVEFSLCLFFAKLVCYTFLYWLPYYIKESTNYSPSKSADVSTIFDLGGIVGGIAAGVVTDYSGMSATTCAVMLVIAVPLLLLYSTLSAMSEWLLQSMLAVIGFFANGPYALITTAVSAELGTHKSLVGNSKALATVTAIIDGTGSIGAAVGPLLAGVISSYGWQNVFYMLIASNILALFMLTRLVSREVRRWRAGSSNVDP